MIENTRNKVVLPFDIDPICKGYHNRAFPLGIIQKHIADFDKWICNKLINFVYYGENGKFDIYEPDIWSVEDGLTHLQEIQIDYTTVGKEFIEINKRMLSQGFYVTGSYNEYYIPKKSSYHIHNHTHDYILYGYDDEKGIFKSAGYLDNQKYDYFELDYDDYLASIRYIDDEYFWLEYHKVAEEYKARINKEEIETRIKNYLASYEDKNGASHHDDVFGISACEKLVEYIACSEGNLLQVRYTRIYMEHKAMMHKRLDTMYREALIHDAELVQVYFRDVYRMANLVFALSVKYNLVQDYTILKKMGSMVRNINSIESIVLERLLNELRRFW